MTDPEPYASPPCYAHETDPAYAGCLPTDELLVLLAEAHRALAGPEARPEPRRAIEGAIARLGGTLPEPGDAPAAADALDRLRAALPRIADDGVHWVLKRALDSS